MKDEDVKEGLSTIKKTVIGVITTVVTAAGAYVTTHIEQIFGPEPEPVPVETVEAVTHEEEPIEQVSEQNVNVQGPTINVNIPAQPVQTTRVIERVVEKPVEAPAKEVEDEDPW